MQKEVRSICKSDARVPTSPNGPVFGNYEDTVPIGLAGRHNWQGFGPGGRNVDCHNLMGKNSLTPQVPTM